MTETIERKRDTAHRLSALRGLWPYLKPHKALALGWLLFLALSSTATLVLPVAVRHMIDQGFKGSDPAVINRTFIALFAGALVLAMGTAARYF
jgi:ATP-binding cassette subfamily B protein